MPAFLQGEPVWDIQPHTLEEVKDLSLNFFFLLPVSDARESHIFFPSSPLNKCSIRYKLVCPQLCA